MKRLIFLLIFLLPCCSYASDRDLLDKMVGEWISDKITVYWGEKLDVITSLKIYWIDGYSDTEDMLRVNFYYSLSNGKSRKGEQGGWFIVKPEKKDNQCIKIEWEDVSGFCNVNGTYKEQEIIFTENSIYFSRTTSYGNSTCSRLIEVNDNELIITADPSVCKECSRVVYRRVN